MNLLAAGISIPAIGYSGSGIYNGRNGALNSIMSDVPLTKLLVAQVPKNPSISSKQNQLVKPRLFTATSNPMMILTSEELPNLKMHILKFSESFVQKGVECHNKVCCHYDIEVSSHGSFPKQLVRQDEEFRLGIN